MPKLPSNPPRIEPITADIVPYVSDGQIVWKVGWIEYTTTSSQRHGGSFSRNDKPNPVGHGQWKPLQLDNDLYFDNFLPLRLKANQYVWWRAAR
jgi:hypothetical protein